MKTPSLGTVLALCAAALCGLIQPGCGEDDTPAATFNTPASEADTQAYCDGVCAFEVDCDLGSDASQVCVASCNTRLAAPAPYSQTYTQAAVACFERTSCDPDASLQSEDCIFEGLFATTGASDDDPAPLFNHPDTQACLSQRDDCGDVFADDLCRTLMALTDDQRSAANQACTGASCDAAGDCWASFGAFTY